jgi:nucleoid-associated protein YgaU
MGKSITAVFLAFSLSAGLAFAQTAPALKDNAPDRYTVQKGDTLWSIASKFLKEPWRWTEIWKMNQDQIKNPNRIFPGNVIVLDRSGAGSLALANTVRVSPQVRSEPVPEDAIPAIPPNIIEPFLTNPLVIEEDGLANAPRIVATQEGRVNIGPGDLAYISGARESKQVNWQIFRPGKPLVDPESKRTLGYEAVFLGTGKITRPGDPATFEVVTANQEIGRGDRLIPTGRAVINEYLPRVPKGKIEGRIVSIFGGITTSEGGANSIITLNKGSRDGLENGHVLAIYRLGANTVDPASTLSRDIAPTIRLPDERYGIVMIFRTFGSVSYALVMESSRPVTTGDYLRTP